MDVEADLLAPCSPERLFGCIDDLARYPGWLEIVTRAEPVEAGVDGLAAWQVELRGRLGPLARSKRLRMVRVRCDAPVGVTFERRELDGRQHAPWVLRADVSATADGSSLAMHLHYGGSLWGPVLERLLGDEIQRSRPRLLDLVAD